jgi:hypothetical protein
MRSSSARISMPIAPCPRTAASRPDPKPSPANHPARRRRQFAVGLDFKIQPRQTGERENVASSSPRSATFASASKRCRESRRFSNPVARRATHFAPRAAGGNVAPFGKSFSVVCGLKPRNALWPGDQSSDFCVALDFPKNSRRAINQNVAHILALGRGGENQSRRQIRRQIFQAVDGEVGLAFEQRDFEFLREQTFRQAAFALARPFAICRRWS